MRCLDRSPTALQIGTFVKTNAPQLVEVLGLTPLDFAVIDAEHAPFDRTDLDRMIMAGRAVDLPIVVRIPDTTAPTILSTLDMGAAGLLVPHVDTPEAARAIVARTRHRGGERGFSGSPRFADYGAYGMKAALDAGVGTLLMAQIESAEAVSNVEAIAAVPGIDGLFIGRADLALSMGFEDMTSPQLAGAVTRIIAAAKAAGRIAGMFVSTQAEREQFAAQGVTWFTVGSDQSMLRAAALAIANPAGARAKRG